MKLLITVSNIKNLDNKVERLVETNSNVNDIVEQICLDNYYYLDINISDYYFDTDSFIKETLSISTLLVEKSLWLIETGEFGYDMYDSGVFCAYTEQEALEFGSDRGRGFSDNNSITKIGTANKDLKIGEVCLSFNAG
jgi:hypothetical protein